MPNYSWYNLQPRLPTVFPLSCAGDEQFVYSVLCVPGPYLLYTPQPCFENRTIYSPLGFSYDRISGAAQKNKRRVGCPRHTQLRHFPPLGACPGDWSNVPSLQRGGDQRKQTDGDSLVWCHKGSHPTHQPDEKPAVPTPPPAAPCPGVVHLPSASFPQLVVCIL